ncbi:MAG: FecR domain-containing protein [Terriglobales bacterium]
MRIPGLKAFAGFFLAAILSAPALGDAGRANSALPGTLNYVEGQASIGSQVLNSEAIGSSELQSGQSLTTQNGKAEVLLTPGVFLRVGADSSVTMVSPSITDTELAVNKGRAMVEVAEIHPQNDIRITEDGATTKLLKTGLYDFDSNRNEVRVFDGKAVTEDEGHRVTVKGSHEVNLAQGSTFKAKKFDKKSFEEGDLYRWSSLRSAYLAEANVDAAGIYAANIGPWGAGWAANWYWDPWFGAYTFIPANGIFYSPFGWGFYSPLLVSDAPFYGYGYGHFHHHFTPHYGYRSPYLNSRNFGRGIYRGPGAAGRAFRPEPRMMGEGVHSFGAYGGGFHRPVGGFQRGGGFHGGGFRH